MTEAPNLWQKPRIVSVVVDNDSWILPFANELIESIGDIGDKATLCRRHDEIQAGSVAFYLGCVQIAPPEVLAKNRYNLVVHASDLPKGRGFSPLTWQVLEGRNVIPVCLFRADEQVDAGEVYYREDIHYEGHELIDEMRAVLGAKTIEMCQRFLYESIRPEGQTRFGHPTYYVRRYPKDSELDPNKTIAEQFNMLRVVDNDRYPAFFRYAGHRYRLQIEKF